MTATHKTTPPISLSWFIWGLGALFYLVAFFQRVAPGVMTRELMGDFNITAAGLGHLSALYFYPYMAMQIPTGVMADTLGPRKLLTFGCLVAGAGTLMFAWSPGFWGAGIGRLLVGLSVAVAFVGLLKITSTWFPRHFYAFVAGNALSIGLIGAIGAGPPLRWLMDQFNWRSVFGVFSAMTLILGGLIWVFIRDFPQQKGYAGFHDSPATHQSLSFAGIWQSILKVLNYRNTLLFLVIPGGIVGAALTFTGLWGVPYLTTCYQITPAKASQLTACLLLGWAIGGPVFGGLSDRLGRRKPLYLFSAFSVAVGWSLILYIQTMSYLQMAGLLLCIGFFSGCIIVSFPFVAESVPRELSGTVSGLVNMGIMVGPTLMQPLVGFILDRCWDGHTIDNVRIYNVSAYETGFIPMMIWVVLSVLLLFFTKETFCRQVDEETAN